MFLSCIREWTNWRLENKWRLYPLLGWLSYFRSHAQMLSKHGMASWLTAEIWRTPGLDFWIFLIYGHISTNNLCQEPGWFLDSGSEATCKIREIRVLKGQTSGSCSSKNFTCDPPRMNRPSLHRKMVTAPIEIDHFKMTKQATNNANVQALMPGYESLI